MRKQKIAIADIARQAGVSVATVSRVLNNKPDVAPETRARIQELIRRHGFHISRAAVSLSTGRTYLIAMVVGELAALSETVEIVRVVTECGARRSYGTVLCLSDLDTRQESRYGEMLARGNVDGAILYGVSDEAVLVDRLRRSRLPAVIVEPKDARPGLPAVRTDHVQAVRLAVAYLAGLRHRRISIITVSEEYVMGRQHLKGFQQGMEEAGIEVDPDLVVTHRWVEEMGWQAGLRWGGHLLSLPEPPTAIICCADNVALGVMEAARRRGFQVPGQLSVVGYDDIPAAASMPPGLTTVRQRARRLGEVAAACLFRLIHGDSGLPEETVIPAELEVRASTAPPAAGGPV